jgi:DNA-binding transcriptional LysR family regulator
VVPAIAAFTQRYPACKVDAILSDQTLDLMSGNIELAIRVGWLKPACRRGKLVRSGNCSLHRRP